MTKHKHRIDLLCAITALFALSPLPALAAGASLTLRGTITSVNGNTVDIKEADGNAAKLRLADDATVVSVAKASVADIGRGSYIGTAATPRTDVRCRRSRFIFFRNRCRAPAKVRAPGTSSRRAA